MKEAELGDIASSRGEEKKQRDDISSAEIGMVLHPAVAGKLSRLSKGSSSERRQERHNERKEAHKKAKYGTTSTSLISSSSTTKNQKVRLAPGVATTDSHGAVRVGDSDNGVTDNEDHHNDEENILIAAEVAPNMDDMIETEVQERVRAITEAQQQHRQDKEGLNNATAAVAVVVELKSNKRRWIALAIALLALVVAATSTVVSLTQSQVASTEASVIGEDEPVSTDAPSPTTEQPTSEPTMMTRANKVKNILAEYLPDYSPLEKQTLNWLIFVDTWEPDKEDPNHDYLWLERYVMALLYDSTGGSSWTYSTNWKTSEPVCKWWFRDSNECPGPITDLNLRENDLKGTIPSSIGSLSLLTSLVFWGDARIGKNNLKGSIPSSIGNLSLLTELILVGNQLTSSIPSSIGNLSLLTTLYLWDNQLTSSIPSSIGNLSKLEVLWAGGNQFTSSIPSSIWNLSQLTALDLWDNQLTSSIPSSIGNLSKLTRLHLHDNKLTGSIPSLPSSIQNLPSWNPYFPDGNCRLENNCFQNLSNAEAAGCVVTPNCAP